MHVEIKIVNKEAVTKRNTLLPLNKGRCICAQSSVGLIRKRKRKEDNYSSTYIRAIVRECCIIMGGRNNKLRDQKDLEQKRVRQAKKPIKRNPGTGQKGPFQKHMSRSSYLVLLFC